MDKLEEARQRRNALRREQYQLDGGKRREANQAWKEAHREQVRVAGREYQRLRYASNPEHARSLGRASHARNKEKRNAETKAWFKAHPGYNTMKQAEYRKANPVKFMLRNCKNRAKALGVPFTLKPKNIFIPERCPVLGLKLEWGFKQNGFASPGTPSVDRFDNSKGYTPDNIRIISNRANILKRDATIDELKKVLAYMESL